MAVARATATQGHLVAALLVPIALLCLSPARGAAEDIARGSGFGDLKWGDTVDRARQLYSDLRFDGYRLGRPKEEPFRAYVRERASGRVDGVRFDSLEYWFRGDRFEEIHAVLQSRIGPRTLVTEAERSYEALAERFRRAYGVPGEQTVKYVSEYLAVVKETTWERRGVTVHLRYNGAQQGDVDRLTLEMGRKGGAP